MLFLAHFPDEILSKILDDVHFGVIALWLSGDALLRLRMSRCCSKVATSPEMRTTKLWNWPKMFADLKALRVLHVEVKSFADLTNVIVDELVRLPTELSELHLTFKGAVMIPATTPSKSHPMPDTATSATPRYNDWLKTTFPSLKKATFWTDDVNFLPNPCTLPDSLESLKWAIAANSFCSYLPRGLKSLEVGRERLLVSAAKELPPRLQTLTGPYVIDAEEVAALPRTLENPPIAFLYAIMSPEMAAALPPHTRSISNHMNVYLESFAEAGIFWPTSLPKTLTEISFSDELDITPEVLAALPRSLTKITQPIIDWEALRESLSEKKLEDFWSPNLLQLELGDFSDPSPEDFSFLPRTLTSLAHMRLKSVKDISLWLRELPKGLRELTLRKPLFDKPIAAFELAEMLPLHLLEEFGSEIALSPPSFKYLPKGLRTLHLPSLHLVNVEILPFIADLPTTLLELKIHSIDAAALQYLPFSLRRLYTSLLTGTISEKTVTLPRMLEWLYLTKNENRTHHFSIRLSAWLSKRGVKVLELDP